MPEKSAKWRFKCWCTCDATNGYMHHVYVYEGASETRDVDGLGAKVVQCMLEPVYNKHYVYMDDFFSSVQLVNKLKFDGTRMTGTTRTDRKGCLKNLKGLPKLDKQMKRAKCQSEIVRWSLVLVLERQKGRLHHQHHQQPQQCLPSHVTKQGQDRVNSILSQQSTALQQLKRGCEYF